MVQATQMQMQVPGSAVMADTAAQQKMARLTDAAQKFEGMLMQEMLKPLEKSQSGGMWGGDQDPDRDRSLDTMSSFGTEAVANALAKHGGMGIAKRVVEQVTRLDEQMHGQAAAGHTVARTYGGHSLAGGASGLDRNGFSKAALSSRAVDRNGFSRVTNGKAAEPGGAGEGVPEKEQKGTAQVLKFGSAPPMR